VDRDDATRCSKGDLEMRVSVIGQGYVGLTAAACLAEQGHSVTGVERDPERLSSLQRGILPFFEPGLPELVSGMTTQGRLRFVRACAEGPEPDAVVLAVGSPQLPSGGADLRQVSAAMAEILSLRESPAMLMVKSTVPPGTSSRLLTTDTRVVGRSLRERYVYSPEFLSQGSALDGWRNPARIVVGAETPGLLPLVEDLYRGIEAPWVVTTPTNAEMIKYASNAFLATRISFINEIANLCDEIGASVDDVVGGIALDPRLGGDFLRPGVGYGGSCFPKDTKALAHLSNLKGRSMPLLESVIAVNNAQRVRVTQLIEEELGNRPGATVAVLGLSFKPDTDDIREAPSVPIVSDLVANEYLVRMWDPAVSLSASESAYPGAVRFRDLGDAVEGASAIVVLTEWPEVVTADWSALAMRMREPRLLVDGRNCLDPNDLTPAGFRYRGFGRGIRMTGDTELASRAVRPEAGSGAAIRR
jgi:UDPglucose 6-dehydrogenase